MKVTPDGSRYWGSSGYVLDPYLALISDLVLPQVAIEPSHGRSLIGRVSKTTSSITIKMPEVDDVSSSLRKRVTYLA